MNRRQMVGRTMMALGAAVGLAGGIGMAGLPKVLAKQSAGRVPRKPVIPLQVIEQFRLLPAEGYGFWVLGEDNKPYSFDDVLLVMFTLLKEHWDVGRQGMMRQRKP